MAKSHTQTQDTLAEVLCSSPTGSLIEVPMRNYDNVYSFHKADTIINLNTDSKFSLQKTDSLEIIQPKDETVNLEFEETNSELVEVSQSEFITSQKIRYTNQNINILSSPVTQTLQSDIFHSAHSPKEELITSSSPVITQHTQPIESMAPSAQLTSFRLQSPIKILSNQNNLIPKKSDLLVTQESFTVPNLISPTKSPILTAPVTPHGSNSVYSTAIQSLRRSPQSSPLQYEIKKSNVKYKGFIKTKGSSPFLNVSTRLLPSKRNFKENQESDDELGIEKENKKEEEEVLGSGSSEDEDDSNISIIEVTRTLKKQKKSVVQVLSSPGFEKNSSPILSASKSLDLSETLLKVSPAINEEENIDDEFNMMSMDEIKKKIMHYGLKPAKSRLKMIESLREVTKFLSQDSILKLSQSLNFNESQKLIKSDVFDKIDQVLTTDGKLMEMIYTFEPLGFKDLENCLIKNDVKVDDIILKEWCDRNSICLIE